MEWGAPEGYGWADVKLEWSPDGSFIAGSAAGPTAIGLYIVLWDAQTGQLLQRFPEINTHQPSSIKIGLMKPNFGCGEGPQQIKWSPNSQYIGLSNKLHCEGEALSIWDVEKQQMIFSHQPALLWSANFAWAANGDYLAFTDSPGAIKVFDLNSLGILSTLQTNPQRVFNLAFSGSKSIAVAHSDGTLSIIPDILSTQSFQTQALIGEFTSEASRIAWEANPNLIAIGGTDGKLRLWDVAEKHWAVSLAGHNGLISDVAWSADGSLLASVHDLGGLGDPSLRVWQPSLEQPLHEFVGCYGALAFSPDASLIACDLSSQVWIYDLQTGEQIRALELNASAIKLSWSSNGRWLATLTSEKLIVWDTTTWEIAQTIDNPQTSSVIWSPDGRFIAWGGGSRVIQIQSLEPWQGFKTIETSADVGHTLSWSPDGVHLVGGHDQVRVWSVATGELEFETPTQVVDIAWNYSGERLVGVSNSGVIYIWGLPTP